MLNRNIYPFFIALILLVTVIVMNIISFNKMKEFTRQVDHTRIVISSFEHLSTIVKSAEIYSPSYSKTSNASFYYLIETDARQINHELNELKQLLNDNPSQLKLLSQIDSLIQLHLPTLLQKNIVEILQSGEGWRLADLERIHRMIGQGIEVENKLLTTRKANLDKSTSYTNWNSIIFSAIGLILIILTTLLNLRQYNRRRKLQQLLESILNTSVSGIITYSAIRKQGKVVDYKIEFLNKAAGELFGLDHDVAIGKPISAIDNAFAKKLMFDKYLKAVEAGALQQFETFSNSKKEQQWYYVVLAKLNDGVTASFNNITQLKNYEEELKKNIQQLEHSNKELEQYAYAASHDLQEPLRKIITYGNLLTVSDNVVDEKSKGYLSKILSSSHRMSELIKDILSFSALKPDVNFVPTDLNVTLENVMEDVELLLKQKDANIHADVLPVIEAIPLQMHQLFYNLLNNALKFSKAGVRPEIFITHRQLPANELGKYPALKHDLEYEEIVFSDNGIGFSQEYSEQIFGMFKRLKEKKDYPGSGIGLALCKKVVINHGGIMYARSQPGMGATFYIILPTSHMVATSKQLVQ